MAGPIDTRIQPTKVNEFAKSKPINWFEKNLINYVPVQCKGAFRQVYPGFVQLTAFVSMNLERHIKQHIDLANHLAKGEMEKAEIIKTFYDEYFAVMDLPAEFYIETVRDVFQEHLLPQGKLMHRGRPVNPASIRRMGLMTVEGEKDDICSIGQTLAAQDLCTGVRAYRKVHHMQAGVGHYGVFSGQALEQRDLSAAAGFRAREFVRRCTALSPSLRAKRSDPSRGMLGKMDCFVASLPRNDAPRGSGGPPSDVVNSAQG